MVVFLRMDPASSRHSVSSIHDTTPRRNRNNMPGIGLGMASKRKHRWRCPDHNHHHSPLARKSDDWQKRLPLADPTVPALCSGWHTAGTTASWADRSWSWCCECKWRVPTRELHFVNTVHNTRHRNIQARHPPPVPEMTPANYLLSLPQVQFAGNCSPRCIRGHGSPRRRIPGSDRGCQSRADVRRPTGLGENRHDAKLHGGWPGCHSCRRREIKTLYQLLPPGSGSTGLVRRAWGRILGPTGRRKTGRQSAGGREGERLAGSIESWRCHVLDVMMGVAMGYF
jgi:hypothetical protein